MMSILLKFIESAATATALGALIGIERQWRRSPAGLRTNTLVATGAAIFVLVGTLSGNQDSRIAAQIVSGIGFIGGGAILREGLTIRGVSAAATLWCSAAIGTLCGSGFLMEATAGTGLILLANVALRPITYRLTGPTIRSDIETHYLLQFTCRSLDESNMRKLLVRAVEDAQLVIKSIRSETSEPLGVLCVKCVIVSATKTDQLIERIVEALSPEAAILSVTWEVLDQPRE